MEHIGRLKPVAQSDGTFPDVASWWSRSQNARCT